ncbi:small integral membrane protein 26-like [Paralichthys olivaceus]|uniref:small integral membrane protein 26-like n=1 Tax=Paralichthys olivaceus TaxID=8255 RepID=UPI0037529AA7
MWNNVSKWHTRAAAAYAFGVWTMIGSYAFFTYPGHKDVTLEEKKEEDDPNRVVYETAHTKTVIIYKNDRIPYSTFIAGSIRSFFSDPGTGGSDK